MKKALCSLLAFVIIHYTQAQAPTISSFNPTNGVVDGFNTTPANNEVFFGATRATVSASSATSLIISGEKGQKFPAVLIENYLNQGKNVIFKMEGDIHFNTSIKKTAAANTASLQIVSTNKGKIIFGNNAAIISEKGELAVLLQTKGNIIIAERAKISTNGGAIRLQAFEQKIRFSKELSNSIAISGKLNASSVTKGGNIIVESDVIYIHPSAKLYATGKNGGGNILIGGDWQGGTILSKKFEETIYEAATVTMDKGAIIDASATENGNGGKVVLWSNLNHPASFTKAQGQLLAMGKGNSGKGGLIETSGGGINFDGVAVSTIASNGTAGQWLLDPHNLYFSTSDLSTIATNLASSNITITTSTNTNTGAGASNNIYGRGHIVFRDNFTYTGSSARTLTLTADQDIWINGSITATSGALSLSFNAGNRVLLDAGIATNGGAVTFVNNAKVHFQQTSGTQNLNTNGGNLVFNSANVFLLRHSGSVAINTAGGELNLGTGTIQQINTYNQINDISVLLNSWQGAHASGSKTYGINVVAGREYTTRMYFWDSWDGGEQGQLFVRENGTPRYYFQGERPAGGGFTVAVASNGAQFSASGVSSMGRSSWDDQFVDLTFVAVANGTLETWTNLNQDANDESLELNNFYETQFPTFSYASGSRSLSLNTTTGQLVGSTKNVSDLASLTVNTNNNLGSIGGLISGTTNFTKEGTGTFTLTQNNTYSGNTAINAGTFVLQNNVPNPTNKTFNGPGALRIESAGNAFTGAFTTSGWSFGATISNLIIGKTTNTQNVTFGGTTTIAGPITAYGGDININENLNTTAGAANGDVLLKAAGNIALAASRTITTTGGDVILWANSDAGQSNGSVSLRNTSSITTGSNTVAGGNVWIGGGADGATWNGISVGSGYAVPGTSFSPSNGGTAISAGIYLEKTAISTFGGHIKLAGDASTSVFGIVTYGANTLNALTGSIDFEGNASNSSSTNSLGLSFGLHDISIAANTTLNTSGAGTAIKLTGFGRGSGDAIGVSGLLQLNSSGTGAIELYGTAHGTGRGIVAGNYYHGIINAYSASGKISLNGGSKGIFVASAIFAGATPGPSRINLGKGGTITSSTSNVVLTADILTLGASGIGVETTGTATVEPFSNSFSSAIIYPVANLTMGSGVSGLTIGKTTNTQNITFAGATTIAGPITAYGGNVSINENLNTTAGAANGDLLLKASGNITLAASKTITTTGGDVILWADADGSGAGDIFFNSGTSASILTSGGHLWLGGGSGSETWNGLTVGDGYAVGDVARSVNSGTFYNGITINATGINTAGGHIKMRGKGKAGNLTANTQNYSGGMYLTGTGSMNSGGGNIEIDAVAQSGSGQHYGLYNFGAYTFNAGSGNLTIMGDASASSSGNFNLCGSGIFFWTGVSAINSSGNITLIGKKSTTAGTFGVDLRTSINSTAGNITVTGDAFNFASTLTASGIISLNASTSIVQSAAITANGLALIGAGTATLTNASNSINTIAGGTSGSRIGAINFNNNKALTVGTVGTAGIFSTGAIELATSSGDVILTEPVNSTLASGDAVKLFADKDALAGAVGDGNIKFSGNGAVTIASGARALLYSGTETASTGLTTAIGGTANYRYNVANNTVLGNIIPAIATTGRFGLLRATANADLSALAVSVGTLTPTFAAATIAYTASVSNATTSITVTPTRSDANATITVNGTAVTSGNASGAINLTVGANTITTIVTAQDATTTKTYTVTVTRAGSANADLSALILSTGTLTPTFAAATTAYTASVSNATTSITVTSTVAQANATITVNGTAVTSGNASGAINLTVGANTITTIVTAQDGSTKTYTVTVTRAASANADLSALAINVGTLSPTFAAATIAYTASVSNATTTITVTPTRSDANATITVNGTAVTSGNASGAINLTVGANTITTIVSAQDGTTKTYTVTVTRATSANTWTGSNGNFNVGSNWSLGEPTASQTLVINTGNVTMTANFDVQGSLTLGGSGTLTVNPNVTLTVTGGTLVTGTNSLTFKSTVNGSASLGKITAGGTVSGDNVTVERYIPAHTYRAWRLLSVPVKGTQTIREAWQDLKNTDAALHINDINYGTQITSPLSGAVANGFDNVSVNNALLKYNGTAWEGATSTNESIGTTDVALATSMAYFLYIRGARNQGTTGQLTATSATTLRTTGALYQGAVTSATIPANSFEVVGNIYPSRINFTNVSLSGSVDNVFYIWDARKVVGNSLGFYQTFSNTNNFKCLGDNGSYVFNSTGNNKIESGQAFFVHTTGGTGTVTLSEDSKVAGSSSSAFRPATPTGSFVSLTSALRRVSGATSTMADANEVVFSNEYLNALDGNDALKMGNPGENFAVLRNDKSLAVEGRQLITDKDTIFFKMWNLQRSQYSLQFTGSNLNVPGLLAILQDAHTGTNTVLNMTVPTNVDFTVDATAASSAANRFRVVFLQTIGTTLPVNFISISAAKDAAGTKVSWKVAAENGIAQYEVERSANGRSFTKSGKVAASINTTEKAYSFIDVQPYTGSIFYRVKSIGVAGDVKYSTVVKITAGNIKPVFTISPNPAEGNLVNIQFKNQAAGNYQVRISGINGQVLHSSIANHAGGNSTQVINIAERLASGAYQLEIIAPDKSRQVQSLIVKSTD